MPIEEFMTRYSAMAFTPTPLKVNKEIMAANEAKLTSSDQLSDTEAIDNMPKRGSLHVSKSQPSTPTKTSTTSSASKYI
jgi:hypothetical protein